MTLDRAKNRFALALLLSAIAATAFSSPASAANLVPNPSFTDDCGGVPCSWTANVNATISRDTVVFNTSPASLRITAGTATNTASARTCILLAPRAYTLSFFYNISDPGAVSASVSLLYFSTADCTGSSIASSSLAAATEGGWHQASGTPVAVAGTMSALVVPGFLCSTNPCTSGAFAHLDDISLEAVTLAAVFRGLSAVRTGNGVIVRWSTGSEVDTLGFNVYCDTNGKRTRVNAKLIAAKGGGSYSVLDRRAPRGMLVRYWIQEVAANGSRSWHGPARLLRA